MGLRFHELAGMLGIEAASATPSGPVGNTNLWTKDDGKKVIAWLKEHYKPGDVFEFETHGDCWLMLAILYQLRDCEINAFIGPFNKSLVISPYRTGGAPVEGQPCTFSIKERGDDVQITVHLDPEKGPFDMDFSEITAPVIPKGKNIYVKLDGRHLLFAFPISMTYGLNCRSMMMDHAGQCLCCVSNVPGLEIGDSVASPFNRE